MEGARSRKKEVIEDAKKSPNFEGEIKYSRKQIALMTLYAFFGFMFLYFLTNLIFDNLIVDTILSIVIFIVILERFSDTIKYTLIGLKREN